MEGKAHQVSIGWKHSHRRASRDQEASGKLAAIDALAEGKSREEAAQACVDTLFKGRSLMFGGVTVTIDGETFG